MDFTYIIALIIVFVGGKYLYIYLNKHYKLSTSHLVYLTIGGLLLMIIGLNSQIIMYIGIIAFLLGGILLLGKMFGDN